MKPYQHGGDLWIGGVMVGLEERTGSLNCIWDFFSRVIQSKYSKMFMSLKSWQ